MGIEANVLLAIATWANSEFKRTLRLRVSNEGADSHLMSVMRSIYGVAAAYFASRIEDISGNEVERKATLAFAAEMMTNMNLGKYRDILHGPTQILVLSPSYAKKIQYR